MIKSIDKAIKSGNGNAIVYAGAVGLLLSDIKQKYKKRP